jgi:hypothetical protein
MIGFGCRSQEYSIPCDQLDKPGRTGLDFLPGVRCPWVPTKWRRAWPSGHDISAHRKLTSKFWLQLRRIFQNLLSNAMTKDVSDLVACAVREFVRLSLHQPADAGYGLVDPDPSAIYLDGPWYDRSDVANWYCFHGEGEKSWRDCDWMICFATQASQNLLGNANTFAKHFPAARITALIWCEQCARSSITPR